MKYAFAVLAFAGLASAETQFLHRQAPAAPVYKQQAAVPPSHILEAADVFCRAFDCQPGAMPVIGIAPAGTHPTKPAVAPQRTQSVLVGPPAPANRLGAVRKGERSSEEKFFGGRNLMFGVAMFGSAGLDLSTTFNCVGLSASETETLPDGRIQTTTRTCGETNSAMQGAVASGHGSAVAQKMAINGSLWVGSHYLRRSKSPALRVVGWLIPPLTTGVQGYLAYRNHNVAQQFK